MSFVYRVTKSPRVGEVVDSISAVEAFGRDHGPGRYHVDEHAAESLPGSRSSARSWGTVIHHKDGQVMLETLPWDER
jgi:hypothetical protein